MITHAKNGKVILRPIADGPEIEVTAGHVFIELFHGRRDPRQEMDDWGDPGPVFGPFCYAHSTYCADIKMGMPEGVPENGPNGFPHIQFVDEMAYYDGVYYGDWSVFPACTAISDSTQDERMNYLCRHQPFTQVKADLCGSFTGGGQNQTHPAADDGGNT
jgi:hypothetical protein